MKGTGTEAVAAAAASVVLYRSQLSALYQNTIESLVGSPNPHFLVVLSQ